MKTVLVGIAAALMMTGCIIVDHDGDWSDDNSWEKRQRNNSQMISQLTLDSERGQVIDTLGAPDFSEAFSRSGVEYYVLYYRTHRVDSDGETTKSETTPLVFKQGRLIGWGDAALHQAQQE